MKAVEVEGLSFAYGRRPVLDGVSFAVDPGEMMGVVGPNGSGKSTLISILSGVQRARSGSVAVMGKEIGAYRRRELSRKVAAVTQGGDPVFPYTVDELVAMGRYAYQGWGGIMNRADIRACSRAMDLCGISGLRKRTLDHLSAGERQRVLLARALAQDPEVLLLDEAASFLDIGQEQALFEVLDTLRREKGLALLTVSHDLNLVGRFCQRVLLLSEGEVLDEGSLGDVYTSGNLSGLFGIAVKTEERQRGGVRVSW